MQSHPCATLLHSLRPAGPMKNGQQPTEKYAGGAPHSSPTLAAAPHDAVSGKRIYRNLTDAARTPTPRQSTERAAMHGTHALKCAICTTRTRSPLYLTRPHRFTPPLPPRQLHKTVPAVEGASLPSLRACA